jgi:hypothetical protein
MLRDRTALAGARIMTPGTSPAVVLRRVDIHGADMRAIYLRSLLFVFGLIAFVLIESLAPPENTPVAPVADFGHAGHAA